MPDNNVFVLVSDVKKDKLISVLPELKSLSDKIMSTEDWYEFLDINDAYRRNDNKFFMREVRQSKKSELTTALYCQSDDISCIFDADDLSHQINYALSFLKEQPKRRFLKHYSERLTYRQIALEEGKQISTIYESISAAKKLFLKKFYEYPEQNTPNKCK